MEKRRKHTRKVDKYTTIIFISKSDKEYKTINFPKWIKYPISLSIVALIGFAGNSAYNYLDYVRTLEIENNTATTVINDLNTTIDEKKKTIDDLEDINDEHYQTLQGLELQASQVQDIINQLLEEKDSLEEKLGNTKKTTESTPYSFKSIPYDPNNPSNETELALEEPSNKIAKTSYSIENDVFQERSMVLFDNLIEANSMLQKQLSDFDVLDQQADVLIPYWDSYPSTMPTYGTFTSYFGWRRNPTGWGTEFHKGVDISNSYGANVYATGAGTVIQSEYSSSYGYVITISHGYGITTRYAHNSKLLVRVGQSVERGDVIAKIGSTGNSTGPHVHYEVRIFGEPQNPLDYIK